MAHERTGFLGEDLTELSYGLAQLLDNPQECQNIGKRARLRIVARHGAQSLADRLENLYRAVHEEPICDS